MKKDIEILLDCRICNQVYNRSSIKIVSAKGSALLLHLHCSKCQTNSLALISKNVTGGTTVSMGILTDLDAQEAVVLLEQEPISMDEVLDMHQQLTISHKAAE